MSPCSASTPPLQQDPRFQPAQTGDYSGGAHRPRSGDVGPAPRRRPGSRGSTPLWGLRDQRLLARVRRLLARCRAIALRSNGMSTQRASICPDSRAPRRGALKRRRRRARRGRPGVWSAVEMGKADHRPAMARRQESEPVLVGELPQASWLTQPAGTSLLAPRAHAARSASQASPAGRLPRRSRRREARPCCRRSRG
jgi:hypothetical protein